MKGRAADLWVPGVAALLTAGPMLAYWALADPGVLGRLLSSALSFVAGLFIVIALDRLTSRSEPGTVTTRERVDRLSSALGEAATLIEQIQTDAEEGAALVEKVRAEAQHYEMLVRLDKPEVDALADVLRTELRQEGRRSFVQQAALNLVFFVAGVVTTLLTTG